MPLSTRRSSTRRAPGWFLGMNGSITAHSPSENQNRPAKTTSVPRTNNTESRLPRQIKSLIEF
ncbi:hypothetical protein HVPorG_05038 (plasmid) [Roseomonas mucosa]|uniref:hypothetical protein n=1 Tax=Roseomonas mucosa TaxID=207340 RepID=UPI0021FBF7D8|nr:hypothetical protein [Roseomonas mucosa]MDT8351028.1 hypothetical protein [Roseomonas mucosa]QDJ12104.1 hypothetical protein HVPorG_05038 [Roseomonas mucosa]UZO94510.1 hypothetical protein RMP42_05038 [Roseomonas mucosa]